MLLSELRDRVLVEVGSFFLADLSLLGISSVQFRTLVSTALIQWNTYRTRELTVVVDSQEVINFADLYRNYQDFRRDPDNYEGPPPVQIAGIPSRISDVLPLPYANELNTPTLSYQYDKPILKLLASIDFSLRVDYVLPFEIVQIPSALTKEDTLLGQFNPGVIPSHSAPREVVPTDPRDDLSLWEIPGIDTNRYAQFINLVTAKFMIALGRSRRQFILSDLPVQVDYGELVSEGQEMMRNIMEDFQSTSDVYDTLLESPRGRPYGRYYNN